MNLAGGSNLKPWMAVALYMAGIYNLAWGTWVVLDPLAIFRLAGLEAPLYPQIWQCVGMIMGVYGVGYAVAARSPLRHWPIVLVGLLGKILGPVGFVLAAAGGELPWSWGWTIVGNDLVWWLPFGLILLAARREATDEMAFDDGVRPSIPLTLRMARCQTGESLLSLSRRQPRLVVCLRHLGCSFCRETLSDLAEKRAAIETIGVGIVLVHPSAADDRAAELFARYRLDEVPRIADPQRVLYRSLGLGRGSMLQVLGPHVLWRALEAALHGHRPGAKGGDYLQMPGLFLVADGQVVSSFRHGDVAERPDYEALAASSGSSSGSTDSQRPAL